MNRQSSFFALISIALVQCLSLAMSGNALAAEPAWWTQKKQECGLSSELAYNDWIDQGSPCNSGGGNASPTSGGTAPPVSGGGYTPQQRMILNGAQIMMPVLQQGVHDLFYGNPEEEARQALLREQQRRADEQRQAEVQQAQQRAQEEMLRQQELRKQRILSELKGTEPSTELGLKLGDSHQQLMVKEGHGAFGTTSVIPVGLDSPVKDGLQLKLGDDAERSSRSGLGFDTDGRILRDKNPGEPATPTFASITPAEKAHRLDVLNTSLKKIEAEQQSLKDQLATLKQAPSADPATVNHVQEQLTAATAANSDLAKKISDTEKISVSVDLGDAASSPTSAK